MATDLRAGAARIDITPDLAARPIDLTGFIARQNPAVGVRDPLYVRALVLEEGGRQLALISCDLLGFSTALVEELRDHIDEAIAIPGPQVLVATTHTHSGPATLPLIDCGEMEPAYVAWLLPRVVDAVIQAQAYLQPASVTLGHAAAEAGVYNRRTPGDVIDPEIGLLHLIGSQGATIATVVNYTCHPTTLHHENRHISADYPGLICARLEETTGVPALFLMGAIGDVGPVTRGEASLTTIGNSVAEAALAALPGLAPSPAPRLDSAGESLRLPLLPLPTRGEWLQQRTSHQQAALAAEAADQALQAKVQWAMVHWVEQMFEAMQDETLTTTVAAEVQLLRVGDLVLVGVPGEFFVELGLAIKQGILAAGHARQVMVCGFANGNIGYIPARRAYAHGGYEVAEAYKYYGYPAALSPEAGEQIVASAIRLSARL
jgi:hypothetical protein